MHLCVDVDKRKHQKYRTQKATAMWNVIKKLTRLLPEEKAQIIVSQILPILTYGAELYDTYPLSTLTSPCSTGFKSPPSTENKINNNNNKNVRYLSVYISPANLCLSPQ